MFTDGCGTCSTKHALLKTLAVEQSIHAMTLCLGLFKMNGLNTPPIARTLATYQLDYLPEAHNYLRWGETRLDYTNAHSSPADFENDLIVEMSILPSQITDFKVQLHKDFLKQWLLDNPDIHWSLDELWAIRERCIADLSVSHI